MAREYLCEFSIFPIGNGASLSTSVAKAVSIIESSGLPHRLTPMGSIVEGDFAELSALMQSCFTALSSTYDRIYLNAKIDYRKGRDGAIESKVKSVKEKLS